MKFKYLVLSVALASTTVLSGCDSRPECGEERVTNLIERMYGSSHVIKEFNTTYQVADVLGESNVANGYKTVPASSRVCHTKAYKTSTKGDELYYAVWSEGDSYFVKLLEKSSFNEKR